MAPLHADENFDYDVVDELRRLGYDVLTAAEAGLTGVSDGVQLTFASSQSEAF